MTQQAQHQQGRRAIVVGGSIGGLTAALTLRDVGFDVTVFERTGTDLNGRGGGIVLQPDTLRWFRERSAQSPEEVSTSTEWLQYLGPDNTVLHRERSEWSYTSWGTFYRALLSDFGHQNYVLGEFVSGFDQDADGVDLRFVSGRRERADLVVFADGITSTNRIRIDPAAELHYSGYIGWRGTVPESQLTAQSFGLLHDSLTYNLMPDSHIVVYPIPGENGGRDAGERLVNYVWYRNVPEGPALQEIQTDKRGFQGKVSVHPGQVQDRYIDELRADASRLLAPAVAEVVVKTETPFIQTVWDLRCDRMANGRVALIGDAACAARPHAAAGTAKAAADAWALAEHLAATENIADALAGWEPGQLAISKRLLDRVVTMGRKAQFDNSWRPGDPEMAFGLYGPAH